MTSRAAPARVDGPPPGYVGVGDIADALGVTRKLVESWRFRGLMPRPDYRLGNHPVWRISTLARFFEVNASQLRGGDKVQRIG